MKARTRRYIFEFSKVIGNLLLLFAIGFGVIWIGAQIISDGTLTEKVSIFTPWFTLVLAIASILTFLTAFRNRPIKIEIMREHTKALRNIAKKWDEQLPVVPEIGLPFIEGLEPEGHLKLPIEKSPLFRDLYFNHLPRELCIQRHWEDFKEIYESICFHRRGLSNDIFYDLKEEAGLVYSGGIDGRSPGTFSSTFFFLVVMSILNEKPISETFQFEQNMIKISRDIVVTLPSDGNIVKIKQIIESLVDRKDYQNSVQALKIEVDQFKKESEYLHRMLAEELLNYPLLFGECNYTTIPLFDPTR